MNPTTNIPQAPANRFQQSGQYMQEMSKLRTNPNLKQNIARAYDNAVVRGVVDEGAKLQSQYLPTVFGTLSKQGTGAADMSPAAKLNQIGSGINQLTARVGANNAIQNFYGTSMNDMYQQARQNEESEYGRLANMYNTALGREQSQDQLDYRDRLFGYQQQQDKTADAWKERMFAYQQEQDRLNREEAQKALAASRAGGGGSFGGFGGLDMGMGADTGMGDMPLPAAPSLTASIVNKATPIRQEMEQIDRTIREMQQNPGTGFGAVARQGLLKQLIQKRNTLGAQYRALQRSYNDQVAQYGNPMQRVGSSISNIGVDANARPGEQGLFGLSTGISSLFGN